MSILLGVVQSTVHVIAASTPLPTPTPTSSVAPAVVASSPSLLDTINNWAAGISQTDLIAFAALLASSLQALLNKIPFFTHTVDYVQDVRRFLLAVFVPGVVTIGTGVATGRNDFHLLPVVFLGAQIVFYAGRFLVAQALKALASPVAPAAVSTDATTNF